MLRASGHLIISAYNYRLGFSWKNQAGAQAVKGVILQNWQPVADLKAQHWFHLDEECRLYDNETLLGIFPQPETLRLRLQQQVQMCLTYQATDYLFIHAGVVTWHNQALVIPGPSRSGKSTLVLALIQAGAGFYSDEFAVFDRQGLIHSYPRPLWQRLSKTRKRCWTPEELGWLPEPPRPCGLLLITRYQPDSCWRPQELSTEAAVENIWKEVRYPGCRPQAKQWLSQALTASKCLKGVRGEADDLLPGLALRI